MSPTVMTTNGLNTEPTVQRYSLASPALHSLHECQSVEEFRPQFEALTQCAVRDIADTVVAATAQKAIFLVGSLPLGMATAGSDIDFIVLVDDKGALAPQGCGIVNTDQQFAFSNESNSLLAGAFVTLINGITVEVQVAFTPSINRIHSRLRRRGPELSEAEIMILGRLRRGWLLWESDAYLQRNAVTLVDPALDVYCATRNFVTALGFRLKALRVLDFSDISLALNLGRSSVEMAYLAYFASEGYSYLGAKWLAQIGYARGAAERVNRYPLLKESAHLLFPSCKSTLLEVTQYLREVSECLTAMRNLIEQKTLFRIAFQACPQIQHIAD